jgi:hypothetical protein
MIKRVRQTLIETTRKEASQYNPWCRHPRMIRIKRIQKTPRRMERSHPNKRLRMPEKMLRRTAKRMGKMHRRRLQRMLVRMPRKMVRMQKRTQKMLLKMLGKTLKKTARIQRKIQKTLHQQKMPKTINLHLRKMIIANLFQNWTQNRRRL